MAAWFKITGLVGWFWRATLRLKSKIMYSHWLIFDLFAFSSRRHTDSVIVLLRYRCVNSFYLSRLSQRGLLHFLDFIVYSPINVVLDSCVSLLLLHHYHFRRVLISVVWLFHALGECSSSNKLITLEEEHFLNTTVAWLTNLELSKEESLVVFKL